MAGIEEAFERFQDRLAKQESKKYSEDEEYTPMKKDPYPLKLGPLQLGANANITTGQYSPDEYQNISTMNRNLGVRGKLNIPDTGISLLGSMGDVRSSSKNKLNLPFNPMTGEAEPYSETMRDVYKQSPYSIGAQYNPPGTDQLFSALYNKGGGYNLGYNQGPINVSYTSNPGLGNNIMLRGQYNFADGGLASFANGGLSKPGKVVSKISPETPMEGPIPVGLAIKSITPTQQEIDAFVNQPIFMGQMMGPDALPNEDYATYVRRKRAETGPALFAGEPVTMPVLPSTPTPQVDVSTNSIARSLEMAGFTREEIMRILGQQGFADGGLTNTIPPVKGPDSQGVESLFRRRYN